MSFTATQIQFLQRLVRETPRLRRGAEVSRFFCEHFSLGTAVGRHIEYRESHFQAAASLLRAHDLPVEAMGGTPAARTSPNMAGCPRKA